MTLGTLAQIAERVGGRVAGDGSVAISAIAAIDEAREGALTFATTPAYLQAALESAASAILADEALAIGDPRKPLLLVPSARVALMQLLRAFDRPRKTGPFVHPAAVIDSSATLGSAVYVGPGAYVGARASIGDGCVLEGGCYVGEGARIGAGTLLYPQARVLDECVAGDRCILHPGATIGSDGFGYVFIDGRFERIPQIGNVVLGDDVEIGANTCVDRAQTGSTRIGDGTKIDNLCQIGHNCRIGRHTAMAAQTGLAGSTNVGDFVMVGGQAGFKGHITIGSRVKIGAGSKVWSNLPDDAFVSGTPARPHKEELRREVMIRNLPKLVARVDALEKKAGS
ncbi:MAG TPA: UDP-3-O-(3-hydroxymyristoyl)glucosamine N-acyltransferase [Candidatus Baltobacteraceae bacterium]|nr:UDP-3-O-(3-hydroxymyristoyl)glucosamine N-acyltransferase [Candidatus Baltobacteraceae bacterium]